MSLQNTISMTLEQKQQFKSITKYTCVYCNKSNYKSGFFTILKEGGIQLFCSKECADYHKKRKQVLICQYCGRSFENKSSGYKRKYCSNICSVNAHYNKYKKFNWCGMCNEWIKKEDSVFKPAGTTIYYNNQNTYKLKRDSHYCPICKNRLRIRKYKNNATKRRRSSSKE
jgi:uncharacterized protein YbaR (Trm112 family)